jgi:hypothetical protein
MIETLEKNKMFESGRSMRGKIRGLFWPAFPAELRSQASFYQTRLCCYYSVLLCRPCWVFASIGAGATSCFCHTFENGYLVATQIWFKPKVKVSQPLL